MNAKIPINIAMKSYMQLKFLIKKQMPGVIQLEPSGSDKEQSNVNQFT